MPLCKHMDELEALYARFNRRDPEVHDPIVFLYDYADPEDREVAAVVASSLAYGRVAQILASVRKVLDLLGRRPAGFLRDATDSRLAASLGDFRHRFTTGSDLAALLGAVRDVRRRFGSLNRCFLAGMGTGRSVPWVASSLDATHVHLHSEKDVACRTRRVKARHLAPQTTAPNLALETYLPAITFLAETLRAAGGGISKFLLPSPRGGSACKRLNLMLRWLIRRDAVDPGGWEGVSPRGLLVPLDVHMHRMARKMGATRRKAANLRTVLEVTAAFRRVCLEDPAKYDFALTRQGILGRKRKSE